MIFPTISHLFITKRGKTMLIELLQNPNNIIKILCTIIISKILYTICNRSTWENYLEKTVYRLWNVYVCTYQMSQKFQFF